MRLIIPVKPMGAVRMTNRGKWISPRAKEYLNYKNAVGLEAKRQAKLEVPINKPIRIREIIFVMPLPKDKRVHYKDNGKRMTRKVASGDYHTSKPDIDNLFKGVTDALNGIIWADDSLICEIGRQIKIYGEKPRIEIEVENA